MQAELWAHFLNVVAFPPGFPITVLSWRRGDDSQLL